MSASSRANVLILALAQALALSAIVMSMALAAILGSMLAPDKGLATLPLAAMVIGTAIACCRPPGSCADKDGARGF